MLKPNDTENKAITRWCQIKGQSVDIRQCRRCALECRNPDGKEGKPTRGHQAQVIVK